MSVIVPNYCDYVICKHFQRGYKSVYYYKKYKIFYYEKLFFNISFLY